MDTLRDTLTIFADMAGGIKVKADNMRAAALQGFATATDLADYLVKRGLPFRDAHEVVAHAVRDCEQRGCDLADLTLAELQAYNAGIGEDVHQVLTLEGSVAARKHVGGTAPSASPRKPAACWRRRLANNTRRASAAPTSALDNSRADFFVPKPAAPHAVDLRGSGALSGPPRRLLYSSVFAPTLPPPPGCGTFAASRLPRKRDHAVFPAFGVAPDRIPLLPRPRRHMPTAASASAPAPPTKKASTFPAGISRRRPS